jgi:hypothetical protein
MNPAKFVNGFDGLVRSVWTGPGKVISSQFAPAVHSNKNSTTEPWCDKIPL